MFFVPIIRRTNRVPAASVFDRFFNDQVSVDQTSTDDKPIELSFDVPGVSREQMTIGIEGNVIRIETLPEASRQYKAAYELPQDIDVARSEAKLENGVLTLKLAKVQPESKAVKLSIN